MNYSDAKIGKLINHLKIHQSKENDGVTLFLGAGCSLASSPKDISTVGIITDIVRKHLPSNEELPKTWNELYTKFINLAWNGLGNVDKINLLKPYFDDIVPSEGYWAIQYLVSNHYVQNIITTNFDPLIDRMLENVPHKKIVGIHEVRNDAASQLTFIKAHGDLENGELRFSPYELQKLPEKLSEQINKSTHGIVLVIGYRGQDIGIMNSLNVSDDHCAFWINPSKPEIYDGYNNDAIYNWMRKRNSEDNFIYGQYGNFNYLLPEIVNLLSASPERPSSLLQLWENCLLYDTMSMSKRILKTFSILLEIEESLLKPYVWTPKAPYFSENPDVLTGKLLHIYCDSILPKDALASISNGLEALLFSFVLNIFIYTQGFPVTIEQLLDDIQANYSLVKTAPQLSTNFWILAKKLLSGKKETIDSYFEISMTFDLERDFSYVLKKGEFAQIYSLFAMTKIIALFLQTALTSKNIGTREYHAKIMFENVCQKIESTTQSVIIKLADLDNEQHLIFQNYLLNTYKPLHQCLENRYTYFIDKVYIEYEVNSPNNEFGLYDEFLGISVNNMTNFFEFSEKETFVPSEAVDTLNNFILSTNAGLMMIGPSGSGKTTVLKYWANFNNNRSENTIIPFVGREHRLIQVGTQVFSNWLNEDEKIKTINDLFYCRKQRLILIYDAVNEMPGDFNFLQENYNSLVDFANKLALHGCRNIKLILTMRTDTFLQLKQNNSKELKTGVFFTSFSETGDADNVYEMPMFNKTQALELLKKYVSDTTKVQFLYKRFFNILQIPFYIQLFAKILASLPYSSENDFILIGSKWYDALFQRITHNELEIHKAFTVADNIVINKYLHNSTCITIKQLSQSMKVEEKEVVLWIKKLKEAGILYFDSISKQISFTHDIYEEIFLAKYLTRIEAPEHFCASVLQHTREHGTMYSALCSYLQMLRVDKEKQYFFVLIQFFRLNIISLTRATLAAIIHIQENFPIDNFWLYLFNLIDMNVGLVYHAQLLRCVLQELNDLIEQKQTFSLDILDSLQTAVYAETNSKMVLAEDTAFFEYIYARYLYVYTYLFDENVLDKAKLRCLKALSLLDQEKKHLSIYDDVNFLYSVLLRYEGNIVKAADICKRQIIGVL